MHDHDHPDHAPLVPRRRSPQPRQRATDLVDLARAMGNRAFTRVVVGLGPVPASGGAAGTGATAPVQRSSAHSQGAGPLDPDIEADIRSARGGGRPLDDPVRQDMETRLGADLSDVRIHADARGDELSHSVQADAFTTGADVFFRSGSYSPDSSAGRQLLAHELTHVVQQTSGAVAAESRVSHPDDPHEQEASAVADAVAASPAPPVPAPAPGSPSAASLLAQRQPTAPDLEDDDDLTVARQAAEPELELDEEEKDGA